MLSFLYTAGMTSTHVPLLTLNTDCEAMIVLFMHISVSINFTFSSPVLLALDYFVVVPGLYFSS